MVPLEEESFSSIYNDGRIGTHFELSNHSLLIELMHAPQSVISIHFWEMYWKSSKALTAKRGTVSNMERNSHHIYYK
jgi:hypothetical protein